MTQNKIATFIPRQPEPQKLTFSPLAWLKLMFFLHAGDTEVGGFGISDRDNPLYIEEFITVRQKTTSVSVAFEDSAVADYFDACVDRGLSPQQFARIWCHTHPGESPHPSTTDEQTFSRVFGTCDWSIMFIIGRTGKTYARLAFRAGPGANLLLPVTVDWESWPEALISATGAFDQSTQAWTTEYASHVIPTREMDFFRCGSTLLPQWDEGFPLDTHPELSKPLAWDWKVQP